MISAVAAKLANILDIEGRPRGDEEIFVSLAEDLERYLLRLTGKADRDLDRIEYEQDGHMGFFVGWGEGVRRLLLSVEISATDEAHLVLRATKGSLDIADVDWGNTGPDVGNSILIMRLLHVGICSFRALGFRWLRNDPWDERLRFLYTSFGFANGELLDLHDPASITIALTTVSRAYLRFNIDLADPPP